MKQSKSIVYFLVFWIALNLVQAFFTELISDEAYYWYYSEKLSWGYFDHPPVIAALIRPGYLLFQNELGVRLLIVLSSAITIFTIYKIFETNDLKLFFVIVGGAVITHLGGFIAVPDIPLLLFAALFFYFFKQYLKKDSVLTAFFLAMSITGMAYSKYHGALVVVFALLPNLRLFRRPSLWIAGVVVLASLVPHFLWQYEHGFPTFRYHLFDRSNEAYHAKYIVEYLLGQLLIFGPLSGLLIFPAAFLARVNDDFGRTMKWCLFGFFGFFLFQSMKGRVEPNWTVIAAAPLFYLSFFSFRGNERGRKWLMRLFWPGFLLIVVFRIYMMFDFLPSGWVKKDEFHGWRRWAAEIENAAGNLPVIFQNSYQKPSKYLFYTGKFAHAANAVDYAGKEYDLRVEAEEFIQGKTVFKIWNWGRDSLQAGNILVKYDIIPDYQYFNRVKIRIPKGSYETPADSVIRIPITLENPTDHDIDFYRFPGQEPGIQCCLMWNGRVRFCQPAIAEFPIRVLKAKQTIKCVATIPSPPDAGKHWNFRLGIQTASFIGRNSNFIKIKTLENLDY